MGQHKGFRSGTKLYQQRAKEALPILVGRAKAGRTITYGQLARLMHMPNARNLNYVLGAIGDELLALGKAWKQPVPPIECLVINKTKQTPGRGIGFHMPYQQFQQLTPLGKRQVLQALHADITGYRHWDRVLDHFGLQPVILAESLSELAKQARQGGTGEGAEHATLKDYLAKHPEVLGLPTNASVKPEHLFNSCDRIDLLFRSETTWIGVEVKGPISNDADLLRGIFQCVKYRALIEATQRYEQRTIDSSVLLASSRLLPAVLRDLADLLDVTINDGITMPKALHKAATK